MRNIHNKCLLRELIYVISTFLFYTVFRPWHLLKHESFISREVSFEFNAEKPGYALTLLANLEECGTGILAMTKQ